MNGENTSLAWEMAVRLVKLTVVISLACVLIGVAAGILGGDERRETMPAAAMPPAEAAR